MLIFCVAVIQCNSNSGWIFFWRNADDYLMIACDSEFHITEYRFRPEENAK